MSSLCRGATHLEWLALSAIIHFLPYDVSIADAVPGHAIKKAGRMLLAALSFWQEPSLEKENAPCEGSKVARVNIVDKGGNPFDGMSSVDCIKDLGWHLEVLIHVHGFEDLRATFDARPFPVSVGHLGYMKTDNGIDHPRFGEFLYLLPDGNTWVKLSGS